MCGKLVRPGSTILSLVMVLALSLALAACGSSSHTSSSTTPTGPTSTAMINIGDSPSDQVVAFAMTINSITLSGPNGTVTVLPSATTVEMTRLIGSEQPVSLLSVPQGTYASATINTGSAAVSFMNPGNPAAVTQTVSVPSTTVNFSSPMTVGTTPVVFNFDMDMSHSVNISGGTVTVNPTYTASMGAPGSGNSQDPENGAMHVIGSVSGAPGSSSFGMSMMQSSQAMNFVTNSSTNFTTLSGAASGMEMMGNGQIVSVDAMMQPDGTLLAHSVHALGTAGGVLADGMMQSVSGSTFSLIAQNGTGSGMMTSMLGNGITVNATGTTYSVDTDGIDMTGLPFSATSFSGSTISAVQRVQAVSSSPMGGGGMMMGGMSMAGSMTANSAVRLVQQGFSGTVASTPGGSPTSFTITLDPNSAFATLTGAATMTVYQQGSTELRGLTSVTSGAQVRVRGLLFHNSGAYQMVATRIMAP